MHSENSGRGNATGGRGKRLLFSCSLVPLISTSREYVQQSSFSFCLALFSLHKNTMMLTVRISPLVFSLHHARGQRMIARARALHIEDGRRNAAQRDKLV